MNQLYGNAVVGQSGGPTAAINATLAGVIRGVKEHIDGGLIGTLYGMRNGIDGFMKERLINLSAYFDSEEKLQLLEHTPAAALGSCRKKLPKLGENDAFYESMIELFKKYNIRYFFYIGGNDSMDTVAKLSAYTKSHSYEMVILGVPKTIDNDLVGTDHTPGFGSAAKYICATVQEIIRDCAVYTVPAVTIVEIMGRDAGWLTAASAIGRVVNGIAPDLVYLPERTFDMERFFSDVRAALEKHPNVVVAVSEGIRFADGRYVGEGTQTGATDAFGHAYLAGTGKALELAVKAEIGCKVRSIELNLPQRCAAHLASATDLCESVSTGRAAVKCAGEGTSRCMITAQREEGEYRLTFVPRDVSEIANKIKYVDDSFINPEGNHVTDACCHYLLPLIQGEAHGCFENGLPKHLILE
ncbi:MAG: 6-phosphofructokinase [Ruminococcaceae bacterium]|nr:6-phosphofructokinase [Oscillospiraceae bacterium]